MAPPDFLVVGHLVQDKVAGGYRLGGTAAYASLTAHRLGLRTAILTRAAADLDLSSLPPDIEVHRLPSPQTTVFENIYSGGPAPLPRGGRRRPPPAEPMAAAPPPASHQGALRLRGGPAAGRDGGDTGPLDRAGAHPLLHFRLPGITSLVGRPLAGRAGLPRPRGR